MLALFGGILPLLQAISSLIALWGLIHVGGTTETIITYGAAEATSSEWFNSFGSLALGAIGWAATYFTQKRQGSTSELIGAFTSWIVDRNDAAKLRRLRLATIDLAEVIFKGIVTTQEDKEYLAATVAWLRLKSTTPIVTVIAPQDDNILKL